MAPRKVTHRIIGCLAIVMSLLVALAPVTADARAGAGGSFGSRGTRTYTAPPTTNTAPKTAAPVTRSSTQPGSTSAQNAAPNSWFGGLRSLLLGGLIGAGLASLFGVGAFASIFGFLLQIALIGGIIWLAINYFRNRKLQPAMAGASASAGHRGDNVYYREGMKSYSAEGRNSPLTIGPNDYNAFEALLGEIQIAYGNNDRKALSDRATPEMATYFAEELDTNAKKGVRNEVSQPKLLQGDLAEAWRETDGEFATVAMRYSIIDATVDASSGHIVSGSKASPQEVTEVWTFRRPRNGDARQWKLSAIQQV
jgi:predicted lipid-binding transport protein (Tim44 family)